MYISTCFYESDKHNKFQITKPLTLQSQTHKKIITPYNEKCQRRITKIFTDEHNEDLNEWFFFRLRKSSTGICKEDLTKEREGKSALASTSVHLLL